MYTRGAPALDLFTDSVRLMGDATICGVMECTTRLDPARLGNAAQACLAAHPVLHSRLVRGSGPAYWAMIEPAPRLPVEIVACSDAYHPAVIGPVDPYGPLQVRVRLLRRPSGDVIVLGLAHAAADAFGMQLLMAQLLEEYLSPGSIRPAAGGIPARDTLWTRDLMPEALPAEPDETSEKRMTDAFWPDPFGTSDAPGSFHRSWIGPGDLAAIRARAKRDGGTLNDALIAAYFLATSELTGLYGPVTLYIPVNLRRHLHDGSRAMSNQSTNVSIPAVRREGEGMAEVLPRIISATAIHKKNGIGIAEQIGMDASSDPEGRQIRAMVEEMAAMQHRGFADIFFSNPGPIALPDLPGLADAYLCYPGTTMPTTCLITSTFRGRMTITIGYQDSPRCREGTLRLMELFRGYLLSLTG